VLSNEFWSERPWLGHIRDAARSQLIAPDALLGATLARACVYIDYRYVLPRVVRLGSLNLTVVLIGGSGAGKGGSMDESLYLLGQPRLANDYKIKEVTIGSGEGIVHGFCEMQDVEGADGKSRPRNVQVLQGLLVRTDEGQMLQKLAQRSGQTTPEVLRQAFSGERLGNSYASEEKKLNIPAHGYRLAQVMALQPNTSQFLFDDEDGGTPQRLLWLATIDPNLPDELPSHPRQLKWAPPSWPARDMRDAPSWARDTQVSTDDGFIRSRINCHPDVLKELRADRVKRLRGQHVDPLNGHLMLVRLKVAAVMAALDERVWVDPNDWRLAGTVIATSVAVREWTRGQLGIARGLTDEANDNRYIRRLQQAEQVKADNEDKKVRRVAEAFCRFTSRQGTNGATKTELRQSIMSRDRDVTDAAITLALDEQWLVPMEEKYIINPNGLKLAQLAG
jgi:hypothetical protein